MKNYPPTTRAALQPGPDAAALAQPGPAAAQLARESLSPSTLRNYRANWRSFADYCAQRGFADALDAGAGCFADWIADGAAAGLSPSALTLRAASVAYAFGAAGRPSPTAATAARATLKGARRKAARPARKAPALVAEKLRAVLDEFGAEPGIAAARDRALLALGFGAALRRSEIAALKIGDLEFCAEGLLLTIRSSKTDQQRRGAVVPVVPARRAAHCPVRLTRRYVEALRKRGRAGGVKARPLFRPATRGDALRPGALTGAAVGEIVKRRCAAAGLNGFTGHSLRAGAVTSMNKPGGDLAAVMRHARHSSPAITAGYVRPARRFEGHPGRGIL